MRAFCKKPDCPKPQLVEDLFGAMATFSRFSVCFMRAIQQSYKIAEELMALGAVSFLLNLEASETLNNHRLSTKGSVSNRCLSLPSAHSQKRIEVGWF